MTVVSVTTNSNGCHICGQSVTFTPLDAFTLLTLLPRLELLPHWLMNRCAHGCCARCRMAVVLVADVQFSSHVLVANVFDTS